MPAIAGDPAFGGRAYVVASPRPSTATHSVAVAQATSLMPATPVAAWMFAGFPGAHAPLAYVKTLS